MVKISANLSDNNTSIALFERLVAIGGIDVAIEFFRKYEGRYVYFCPSERIKKRCIAEEVRKEFNTGKWRYQDLAERYGVHKLDINQMVNYPRKTAIRSVELFNSMAELIGTEKTLELFDVFRAGFVLCKIGSLLYKERNERIVSLYKKEVDVNDIATMFNLNVHTVYEILRKAGARDDRWRRKKSKGSNKKVLHKKAE